METLICPTCDCSLIRLGISKEKATKHRHGGEEYLFCCKGCADVFAADPEICLEETKDLIVCPTCLAEKPPQSAVTLEHAGQEIHFCRCPHCLEVFQKTPDYYLKRLQGVAATRQAGGRETVRPGSDRDAVTAISRGDGDFDRLVRADMGRQRAADHARDRAEEARAASTEAEARARAQTEAAVQAAAVAQAAVGAEAAARDAEADAARFAASAQVKAGREARQALQDMRATPNLPRPR